MSALSLAEVRWRTRRDPAGGPPLVQASFLRHADDHDTAATVGAILSYVASLVGQPRPAYDPAVPVAIAGDRILGRGVALACQHWYRWAARDVREVVPPHVTAALGRAGIESAAALRLRLFDLVNARHPGFVPSARRPEALVALAQSLELAPEDAVHLDRALWLDADAEAVLAAVDPPPTVPEVVARYNREVLAALLRRAERVVGTLHAPAGGLVRRLYALGRRLGVYCDVERAGTLDEAVRLTLAGPAAVVGPPAAAGPRLATVALALLRQLGPSDEVVAELVVRDRPCRLRLDRALRGVPGLAGASPTPAAGSAEGPWDADGDDGQGDDLSAATFDSAVEARLARDFAALRRQGRAAGWRLVREPAALLAGHRVLLPDFALLRGATRVFVEVAGFWTEGYLTKKRRALEQLPPATPLVLAVAPPAAAALAGLPFPLVPYRDTVPVAQLLAAAEAHFGDVAARTAGAADRLAAACAADRSGRLPAAALAPVLGCYSPGEVARTLAAMALPAGWAYLPAAGLVGPRLQAAVDTALAEAWAANGPDLSLSLTDLRRLVAATALPEDDASLTALLEQRPWACRVMRRSLFAVELRPPGAELDAVEAAAAGDHPTGGTTPVAATPATGGTSRGRGGTGARATSADRRAGRGGRRTTTAAAASLFEPPEREEGTSQ